MVVEQLEPEINCVFSGFRGRQGVGTDIKEGVEVVESKGRRRRRFIERDGSGEVFSFGAMVERRPELRFRGQFLLLPPRVVVVHGGASAVTVVG